MSYPYIEINEHKFSLVSPYTIDDQIITKVGVFNVLFTEESDNSIKYKLNFKVENGTNYIYQLTADNIRFFSEIIDRNFNDFLRYERLPARPSSWGRDFRYIKDTARMVTGYEYNCSIRGIFVFKNDTTGMFSGWIDEVNSQTNRINNRIISGSIYVSNYLQQLHSELRRQRRELEIRHETIYTIDQHDIEIDGYYYKFKDGYIRDSVKVYSVNDGILGDVIQPCLLTYTEDSNGEYLLLDQIRGVRKVFIMYKRNIETAVTTITNEFRPEISGQIFTSSDFYSASAIHLYNYIPEYKKYFCSGESEDTTLLMGCELEFEEGGKSEEHAKEVLKIMNGSETSEKYIYAVGDGSLHNGIEFPTMPCSLEFHKTLNYENMFKYLDEHGYKGHDSEHAGLHIHINRSFFKNQEEECICKLIYVVERFNDEITVIGRRGNNYSQFVGYNGSKGKEMRDKYSSIGKYAAVNTQHKDTIELRFFKSTLKYSTFMLTLEFVQDLAMFVRDYSEEEIENMGWNDLYNTFSDKLKDYYQERKSKAGKDTAEKKKKDEELRVRQDEMMGIWEQSVIYAQEAVNRRIYNELVRMVQDRPTTTVTSASDCTINDIQNAIESVRTTTNHAPIVSGISNNSSINNGFTGFGQLYCNGTAISGIRDAVLTVEHNRSLSEQMRTFNFSRSMEASFSMENCFINFQPKTYDDMPEEKKVKNLKKDIKREKNPMRKKQLQQEIQELQKEINKKKRSKKQSRS